jgi:hypothetical protein
MILRESFWDNLREGLGIGQRLLCIEIGASISLLGFSQEYHLLDRFENGRKSGT